MIYSILIFDSLYLSLPIKFKYYILIPCNYNLTNQIKLSLIIYQYFIIDASLDNDSQI